MINSAGIVLKVETLFYLMLFDCAVFDKMKDMEWVMCVTQKLGLKVKRNSLQFSAIITIQW